MAESSPEVASATVTDVISDAVKDVLNDTFGKSDLASTKSSETGVGEVIACSAMLLMALYSIYSGSLRSIKESNKSSNEVISMNDAMTFPFIASATLCSLFLFFKVIPKEYINIFISLYFFGLGAAAMLQIYGDHVGKLFGYFISNKNYNLHLTEKDEPNDKVLADVKFDRQQICAAGVFACIALWYSLSKHWIANNLIGLAFSINGIELLQLSSVKTGIILLVGLFFYDIFFVFGTNVMVTVAKNFEAPIKVCFPRDVIANGLLSNEGMSMLGLGDIVIPGIFIALLLRFDRSLGKDSRTYFNMSFLAYFAGLLLTMVIMHVFGHAQPALLYLVPFCIGVPLIVALIKGELKELLAYQDDVSEEETSEEVKTEEEKKEE